MYKDYKEGKAPRKNSPLKEKDKGETLNLIKNYKLDNKWMKQMFVKTDLSSPFWKVNHLFFLKKMKSTISKYFFKKSK